MTDYAEEIRQRWALVSDTPWHINPEWPNGVTGDDGDCIIEVYFDMLETASAIAFAPDDIAWLLAARDRLRTAIQTVIDDEETGHWGPDVTMLAVLVKAMEATK